MGHVINKFDINDYPFHHIVADLFQVDDLSGVHLLDLNLTKQKLLVQENEAETFFHKTFYKKLYQTYPLVFYRIRSGEWPKNGRSSLQ